VEYQLLIRESPSRGVRERMVTCIFCGPQSPGSDEDVISKWIRRTFATKMNASSVYRLRRREYSFH
jgi:hypothetical protein